MNDRRSVRKRQQWFTNFIDADAERFGNAAAGQRMNKMAKSEDAAQRPNKETPQVFKDPVCGMEVNPRRSYSTTYRNKEFRFCSLSCLEKFQADAEAFIKR
jgi:YHS domain-containing protein